ncbi:MAG TPA: histidine-type phosphatase [Pyrinomonadaceae bacterium]
MQLRRLLVSMMLVCLLHVAVYADTLQQVVIVTRHGVRAPTWAPARLNQYSAEPWPDFGVQPGYLTPHGRLLMKIMGEFYRDLYSQAGLLGKDQCGETFFWADIDQRTIESAKALAEGIVPGCKVEVNSLKTGANDPLFDAIDAGVAKPDLNLGLAAVQGRIGPRLDVFLEAYRPAFQLLDRVLNGNAKAAKSIFAEPAKLEAEKDGLSLSGPLSLSSTLTENLLLEYTNGMSGKEFAWGRLSEAELQQVMVLHTAYAELMRRTPYLAKGRGSNLLKRILLTMEQSATRKQIKGALGSPGTSLVVLSGHDTNISNLSGLLGLSWVIPSHAPDDAPPGGALIFSLWKSNKSFFVRVQFVTQTLDQMHNATPLSVAKPPAIANLFVPGCSSALEGYPCGWTSFKRIASDVIEPSFVEPIAR